MQAHVGGTFSTSFNLSILWLKYFNPFVLHPVGIGFGEIKRQSVINIEVRMISHNIESLDYLISQNLLYKNS